MINIGSHQLVVSIDPLGAEVQRIFHREHSLEYLWNGNPEYWGKHAPVLFPIVGQLKDNTYIYQDKAYSLRRHGFARDMEFEVKDLNNNSVVFWLKSNETTRSNYPFDFELKIIYMVEDAMLTTRYEVLNTGKETMYFSIGAHPAFAVPLIKGTKYEDYYLEFSKTETAPRWPLLHGLLKTQSQASLNQTSKLHLNHPLFYEDALIFKNLRSQAISLKSETTSHGVTVGFEGFPYLGIWAAEEAPFVCIEPWCGLADNVYHNQQLKDKEGIISLETGESRAYEWTIECF